MLTDFCGREIRPAHQIAYAMRRGSRLWLNKATVLEVNADHLRVQRTEPAANYPTTIRNLSTVVIISGGAE